MRLTILLLLCTLSLSAQDKLVTKGADTLDCRITGATDAHIAFTTPDEQARKIARSAIKSVYFGGQWQGPSRLISTMDQIAEQGYDSVVLNTESDFFAAALHMDKAGGAMATAGILTALGVLIAVIAPGEDWAIYTSAAAAAVGVGLLIGGGFSLKSAAAALSNTRE